MVFGAPIDHSKYIILIGWGNNYEKKQKYWDTFAHCFVAFQHGRFL